LSLRIPDSPKTAAVCPIAIPHIHRIFAIRAETPGDGSPNAGMDWKSWKVRIPIGTAFCRIAVSWTDCSTSSRDEGRSSSLSNTGAARTRWIRRAPPPQALALPEGNALVRRRLTSIAIPCLNGMPPSLQSIFRDRRTRLRSRQHCVMQTNGRSVRICVTHRTLPVNQNCPNHEGSGPRAYGKSILKTHPLQGPRSRLPTLPEALGYPPFRLHLSRSSMMIADVTPHSSGLN
jgi:hypothetical protein